MTTYAEFFLNSKSSIVQLELLEISHPNFTKTYRVVRNAVNGIIVKHEDNNSYEYTYYPLRIAAGGTRDDLDQTLKIELGDLGEVLPTELDAVSSAAGFGVKPTVKYRAYRSDDLTAPMFGPMFLEVETFSFNREGSSFEAKAPSLNRNKTGEAYKLDRFPMLRGCL